jgi:NTP pyrophosphatase (non-canonical NTP hydrolase)
VSTESDEWCVPDAAAALQESLIMERDRLADAVRQNNDLQAANNALLERARKAEAEVAKGQQRVNTACDTIVYLASRHFNSIAMEVHAENKKWWTDPVTGKRIERNRGEMIALMHSELSEMLEAVRKDAMDDKLPSRRGEEVELGDLIIRALDYAGAYGLDLDGAIAEKRAFNRTRRDHTHEARMAAGGKRF